MWRQEDSHRNSLNAHCYWALRKEGVNQNTATAALEGKSISYKNELLFQKGINYNNLPSWQKRGIGIYFRDVDKEGYNPVTEQKTIVRRRELYADLEIPYGEDYKQFILDILEKNSE
jgi:tRNA(His) 5'-end guanylyltransferase